MTRAMATATTGNAEQTVTRVCVNCIARTLESNPGTLCFMFGDNLFTLQLFFGFPHGTGSAGDNSLKALGAAAPKFFCREAGVVVDQV